MYMNRDSPLTLVNSLLSIFGSLWPGFEAACRGHIETKSSTEKSTEKKSLENTRKGKMITTGGGNKYQRNLRLTLKQRREKVAIKIQAAAAAQAKLRPPKGKNSKAVPSATGHHCIIARFMCW